MPWLTILLTSTKWSIWVPGPREVDEPDAHRKSNATLASEEKKSLEKPRIAGLPS